MNLNKIKAKIPTCLNVEAGEKGLLIFFDGSRIKIRNERGSGYWYVDPDWLICFTKLGKTFFTKEQQAKRFGVTYRVHSYLVRTLENAGLI